MLWLLATGWTNAQIGAGLFISPRTAGVHVTNILRKFGVTGRVQAAAVVERAAKSPATLNTARRNLNTNTARPTDPPPPGRILGRPRAAQ